MTYLSIYLFINLLVFIFMKSVINAADDGSVKSDTAKQQLNDPKYVFFIMILGFPLFLYALFFDEKGK